MKMKKKTFFRCLVALLVCLLLIIVFFANLIIRDKESSEEENRMLQTLPSFSVSEYLSGRLETKLENYVNDQFLLRNWLIKVKTSADQATGAVVSNGVIRCKDHYLMEEITAPDPDVLKRTEKALKKFKNKYSNLDMYFLLAPTAANILSDNLPANLKLNDQNRYMESFFGDIETIGIKPIDVRNELKQASKTEQVYYRTDHHWTTEGAYTAFCAASETMDYDSSEIEYKPYVVKKDFRGTLSSTSGFTNGRNDAITIFLPSKERNYSNSIYYYSVQKKNKVKWIKTTEYYQIDEMKKSKDAYIVFGGGNHALMTVDTPIEESDEVLLIFKDSYANSMIPFLAPKYKRVVVVDPRYYFDDIDNLIKSQEVTQVLFLYNANSFFADTTLSMALTQ